MLRLFDARLFDTEAVCRFVIIIVVITLIITITTI